ncbi:hypothetical protein BPY_07040 [Bifidobacterium psychraerophilum]
MDEEYWTTARGKQRLADASLLLTKIGAHHGNAVPSDLQVRTFAEELTATYTLSDAMEAIRLFYEANVKNQWMSSAQVNAGIRALRRKRIPEETRIGQLMDTAGIDEDRMLAYRRDLIDGIKRGRSVEQAHEHAKTHASRLVIEAPPAKPSKPKQYHFAGRMNRMNLNDVIGETK